jgi:hypothetical protein
LSPRFPDLSSAAACETLGHPWCLDATRGMSATNVKLRYLNPGSWHPEHQSARGRGGISGKGFQVLYNVGFLPLAEFKRHTRIAVVHDIRQSRKASIVIEAALPTRPEAVQRKRFDSVDQQHGSPESRRCRLPIRCAFPGLIRSSPDPRGNCCIGPYRRRAPLLALLPDDRSYLGAPRGAGIDS